MLDVGRLRMVLAVRAHGGVDGAARALSCPPAEVGQQIAALERQLGAALIDGEPPGRALTPAGHRLAGHAERVLADLDAARADVAGLRGRPTGLLHVGLTGSAGRALLPDLLARLRATAPEVELVVHQAGADDGLPALAAGELDVAVIGEYGLVPRRPDTGLDRHNLLTEPVLVAAPAGHPAPGPAVRLADLQADRWIAAESGSPGRELLHRAGGVAGFDPTIVAECADDTMAMTLVRAGHGLALLPGSALIVGGADLSPGGLRALSPVDLALQRTVAALVRRPIAADPAVNALLEALRQAAHRLAGALPGAMPVGALGPDRLGPPPPVAQPAVAPDPAEPGGLDLLAGSADDLPAAAVPLGPGLDQPRLDQPRLDPPPGIDQPPGVDQPGGPAPYGLPPAGDPPAARVERPGIEQPGLELPRRPPPAGVATPPPPRAEADPLGVDQLGVGPLAGRKGEPGSYGSYGPYGRDRPDEHSSNGTSPPARRPAGRASRGPRETLPLGTLPPARLPEGEVRLSIFEELQSEWFHRRPAPQPDAGGLGEVAEPPPWESPADAGWRAAARLSEPATAGNTTAGLPKRIPQALFVPGAVTSEGAPPANGAPNRSPQEVRGRLASYRDGVRRGRHAERPGGDER